MKYTQTIKSLLAGATAITLLAVGATKSSAIAIGASGTAVDGVGMWQSGDGGEFFVRPTSGPLNNASYATTTRNQGATAGIGSFQSFCLERSESIRSPVRYVVNDEAVLGGNNAHLPAGSDGGDVISQGTSWLYSQFAQGTLPGYSYAGATRFTSAALLQTAIWVLEDELGAFAGVGNPFFALAMLHGGYANAAPGLNGVYALNFTQTNAAGAISRDQDMLYYDDGRMVPDGGASVMLLGVALGGMGLARRFMKKS
jgi:hypothetical protein